MRRLMRVLVAKVIEIVVLLVGFALVMLFLFNVFVPTMTSAIKKMGQRPVQAVSPSPTNSPSRSPQVFRVTASGKPVKPHFDMSHPIGGACEDSIVSLPPKVREEVQGLTSPSQAILVRITAIDRPVWNTADGHRPTQAEADDPNKPDPVTLTPFHFSIIKSYSGQASSDPAISYLQGGRIGEDWFSWCTFVGGNHQPQPGDTAVVIVGGSVSAGAGTHPSISDLFRVDGSRVYNIDGSLEPVPS